MKTIINALDEVAEPLREEYDLKDGKFHLKMEGIIPNAIDLVEAKRKVAEFRDRNIELLSGIAKLAGVDRTEDLEPLKKKVALYDGVNLEEYRQIKEKGINLEEYQQMKEQLEGIKKKGVTKGDDVAEIVKLQVEKAIIPIRKELETEKTAQGVIRGELETEKTARVEAQKRADNAMLREMISGKATKVGAKSNALGFLIGHAEDSFIVENNKVVAREAKFSQKNPAEPLGVDEWLEQATKDYDFAFGENKGGPHPPNANAELGPVGPKPGVKQLLNPTPQQLGEFSKQIAKGDMQVINK